MTSWIIQQNPNQGRHEYGKTYIDHPSSMNKYWYQELVAPRIKFILAHVLHDFAVEKETQKEKSGLLLKIYKPPPP